MSDIQAPANKNYCAVVTELSTFVNLPNCDNVKSAVIYGNSVIVSKSVQAGEIGLFFPVETQLDAGFLAANNLYRKPEWGNVDPDKKGFFEQQGRVKAVKFRGHKSEGFWIPLESLAYTGVPLESLPIGTEFDMLGDHSICRKYVPKLNPRAGGGVPGRRATRVEDRIVEGQFRFHYDTENLRRNAHKVHPGDWISISDKWHGTSAVYANLLVKRDLNWFERLLKRCGINIQDRQYGFTWSSRRVIKGVDGAAKENSVHFYGSDIWGAVAREVEPILPKGYTVYGEIVGYTEDGAEIQKGYTYGCQPKTHRFLVYRVTSTNADGRVLELSWQQVIEFCAKYGLEMVKELWYGKASTFGSDFLQLKAGTCESGVWQDGFLKEVESTFVGDAMCPFNNFTVPAEGVVVRIDRMEESEAFKVKSFKFLEWESKALDAGVTDIETEESVVEV